MKLSLQDHFDDFRHAIGDDFFPSRSILPYLNKAQMELVRILGISIPVKRTMARVAHQEEYQIPDVIRTIKRVRAEQRPTQRTHRALIERLGEHTRDTEGITDNFWRDGRYFGLYYIPDESAADTTLYTTCIWSIGTIVITYDSSFPDRGTIMIGTEKISYTANTADDDDTYMTLTGCTRGAEGTVAAGHTEGDTVTLQDIEIIGDKYPAKFLDAPETGNVAISAGGTITTGDHNVMITFYSTALNSESVPLRLGLVTATADAKTISLSNLPISQDSDIDYIKLYMTKAGEEIYYYYNKIANGTTSTTMSTADAQLGLSITPRYSEMSSDIPEEYHELINWLSLVKYFTDIEEGSQVAVYKNLIGEQYPFISLGEKKKKHGYTIRPLPQ